MDRTPQDPSPVDEGLAEVVKIGDIWKKSESTGDSLDLVIDALRNRFNRIPTEEEVWMLLYGDDWEKLIIWNKEKRWTLQCQTSSFIDADRVETAK